MNLIFTLAVATSLTGASTASSLRGVVLETLETFEDQVAVALGGHQKSPAPTNLIPCDPSKPDSTITTINGKTMAEFTRRADGK